MKTTADILKEAYLYARYNGFTDNQAAEYAAWYAEECQSDVFGFTSHDVAIGIWRDHGGA